VTRVGALRSLRLDIEVAAGVTDAAMVAHRVAGELRDALGLTVPVQVVGAGALPRFEMKASRFVVEG
jgi:phenylacetate-coenzyme A ligase PaaK-like adenylate-forming protein